MKKQGENLCFIPHVSPEKKQNAHEHFVEVAVQQLILLRLPILSQQSLSPPKDAHRGGGGTIVRE